MQSSGLGRWSLLAGILFVIFYLVAQLLLPQLDFTEGPDAIVQAYRVGGSQAELLPYVGILSGFFLLWFSGGLCAVLRSGGENHDPLADIALGGGVAASALLIVGFISTFTLVQGANDVAGLGPDAVFVLSRFGGTIIGIGVSMALAAMIGAAGLSMIRTKLLPAGLGWVSLVAALLLMSPLSYSFGLAYLVWIVVVGVWLFVRSGRKVEAVAAL